VVHGQITPGGGATSPHRTGSTPARGPPRCEAREACHKGATRPARRLVVVPPSRRLGTVHHGGALWQTDRSPLVDKPPQYTTGVAPEERQPQGHLGVRHAQHVTRGDTVGSVAGRVSHPDVALAVPATEVPCGERAAHSEATSLQQQEQQLRRYASDRATSVCGTRSSSVGGNTAGSVAGRGPPPDETRRSSTEVPCGAGQCAPCRRPLQVVSCHP
jgi:hypothetical protein